MKQEKINRINELAKLAKQRELSEAEAEERQVLRAEYLAEWRRGAEQTLDNVYIDDGKGNITRLKRKP